MGIPADESTRERWRQRYRNAVKRIQEAGLKVSEAGMEHCVSERSQWDRYFTLLAPKFGFEMDEINTALFKRGQ